VMNQNVKEGHQIKRKLSENIGITAKPPAASDVCFCIRRMAFAYNAWLLLRWTSRSGIHP
jgi:hypothetical protein